MTNEGRVGRQAYKDFVLKIERTGQDTYCVEAQGPTGEGKATFK